METENTTTTTRYAHYFAGRGKRIVIITSTPDLRTQTHAEVPVEGLRDARALARALRATPWNF